MPAIPFTFFRDPYLPPNFSVGSILISANQRSGSCSDFQLTGSNLFILVDVTHQSAYGNISGVKWDATGTPQDFSLYSTVTGRSGIALSFYTLKNPVAKSSNVTVYLPSNIPATGTGLLGFTQWFQDINNNNPIYTGNRATGQNISGISYIIPTQRKNISLTTLVTPNVSTSANTPFTAYSAVGNSTLNLRHSIHKNTTNLTGAVVTWTGTSLITFMNSLAINLRGA